MGLSHLSSDSRPVITAKPVSRRSKPSSRSLLMGVQPHPWRLLHRQDRKSRHRGSKPRGRCGLLPATTLLPSHGARTHLEPTWGNFSVTTRPHQEALNGSLDQAFAPEFVAFRNSIKPAFALALHVGFLTQLS